MIQNTNIHFPRAATNLLTDSQTQLVTDGGRRRHGGRDQLVNVSDLNEFLYCPRRYWYRSLFGIDGRSEPFDEGERRHKRQARYHDGYREQYYRADDFGLHGRVDLIDHDESETPLGMTLSPTPVERKHGNSYYWNDEIQLAGYCLLVEQATGNEIRDGYIYLYGTDTRHRIELTSEHRTAVSETVHRIQTLNPDLPPNFVDNTAKCENCAVRHVCLPATTSHLEAEQAVGSGWEDTESGTEQSQSADPQIDRGSQS